MKPRLGRPAILVAGSVLLVVCLALVRTLHESRTELSAAQADQQSGQTMRALEHYRRAIRWSSPLGYGNQDAISGLESIARAYEEDGDLASALLAWRSLAGGLSATRFLYSSPHPARVRAASEIARLMSLDAVAAIDVNLGADKLAEDHRRLLAENVAPDPLWGTLLLAGFALWLGSLLFATRRGFDPDGRARWSKLRGPIWGGLVGFVSFLLGLLFA